MAQTLLNAPIVRPVEGDKNFWVWGVVMKSIFAKLSVAAVMVSALSSHAAILPGFERPVLKADLVELDNQGREENKFLDKSLTMNIRDGRKIATTFTFEEEVQVQCVTTPCYPIKDFKVFKVTGYRIDGCGSAHYRAREVRRSNVPDLAGSVLTVVDHSNRKCKDLRRFEWDVNVKTRLGHRVFNREFGGHPRPVYTIQ